MIDNPRIGPPPAVSAKDEPNVLTRPSNLPIFAGVVILAAADFVLPWASIPDQVVVDGRNEPDGLITLLLGLLILVLALSRAARESDSRTVQIMPALLGLSVLASMLDGHFSTPSANMAAAALMRIGKEAFDAVAATASSTGADACVLVKHFCEAQCGSDWRLYLPL